MDQQRKKELQMAYKNRKPEMGVLSFRCQATNQSFLCASKDTRTDINSISFKLSGNFYPNRTLLALWNQYGKENFEIKVVQVLPYDEKREDQDYTEDLEILLLDYLEKTENAVRLR